MQKCKICGKLHNRVYKNPFHKGWCKDCVKIYYTNGFSIDKLKKQVVEEREQNKYAFGGYKINILSHTKRGEKRFNVLNTLTEDVYKTDSVDDFLVYISQILIYF